MSLETLAQQSFIEVKCPNCNRHIDKFKVVGSVQISRKCKSCKNNILTVILESKVINNIIDTIENSRDIITPNRHRNPKG